MKLLLLDLDGTIRCSTSGTFIESPQGQEILPGADRGIEHFASLGWQIVGISNQAGIAAGHKTLESTIEEMQYTLELFPKLEEIFFCPDFEGKDCLIINRYELLQYSQEAKNAYQILYDSKIEINFRKPGNGMIIAAIEKIAGMLHRNFLDFVKIKPDFDCWMVGDRPEDEGAAASLGINYLDAENWRRRFLPGMHEFKNVTPKQLQFLEGASIS